MSAVLDVTTVRTFDDGHVTTFTDTHEWPGWTPTGALKHRLQRLREVGADVTKGPGMSLTVTTRRDSWTDVETLTFREVQ